MSYVFLLLLLFFSLPHTTLVATSISHFLTAAMKFSCFSSNEIGSFVYLSLTLAHSSLFRSMLTLKFSRKKELASWLLSFFFLSKSPGGHAIYRQNARAVWNTKCHSELAYKHKLWTAPRQRVSWMTVTSSLYKTLNFIGYWLLKGVWWRWLRSDWSNQLNYNFLYLL